jgi:phosphate starvation-inducible PhoH-like protein
MARRGHGGNGRGRQDGRPRDIHPAFLDQGVHNPDGRPVGQALFTLDVDFDDPQLLGDLFGEFDRNIVAIENRLGVYIAARGTKLRIDGEEQAVTHARDVLLTLYERIQIGEDIDDGAVEAIIAMTTATSVHIGGPRGAEHDPAAPIKPPSILIRTPRKTIVPRSKTQEDYMAALSRDEMIFALGPAGTGKTYLAVAQAVALLSSKRVKRLILSRPAVEAGERLGFLPGDMKEKVDPYLRPLYDALYDTMAEDRVERLIETGVIEIAPIAFMRGRTLADSFIILDEAQNTTPAQMKMFLTRFGMGSQMVICGDPKQVDLPGEAVSGLADAVHKLRDVESISVVKFTATDVVRHPLVGKIVEAYEGKDAPA